MDGRWFHFLFWKPKQKVGIAKDKFDKAKNSGRDQGYFSCNIWFCFKISMVFDLCNKYLSNVELVYFITSSISQEMLHCFHAPSS